MMKKFVFILSLLALMGCKESSQQNITQAEDYNRYLSTTHLSSYEEALSEKNFWSRRLNSDTTGIGDIAPLAKAYERLFAETGNVTYLKHAETLYKKGISSAAVQYRDGFERGLAHNLISQHRFREADSILRKSFEGVSHKRATQLMLFDAAMELGQYEEAYSLLNQLKDMSDINYLIRLSKWSDYKGDLNNAIKYMEMARGIAESMDNKPLKIWTYSNLGDYYGHAGRVQDAYQHYLKTLALQPDNAYVKKGIAWIAYAAEGNASEAHRILDSIMQHHRLPDYHLFKSELFEYQGDTLNAKKEEQAFLQSLKQSSYGCMYNTYLIELYLDTNPSEALALAQEEVNNRATPETYQLLALAQLKNGMQKEALATIQTHVAGKTFEPSAQFTAALVYKANGMGKKVRELKKELLTAAFEVGPIKTQEIENL